MGTTDISTPRINGDVIDAEWYNDFQKTLSGDLVPRDAITSVVTDKGGNLGSAIYQWDTAYMCNLVIDGLLIDFTALAGAANAILSGQVRTTSEFPDFIRADGSVASFTLEAATTSLTLNIDGLATTFTADIVESSLTTAPTTNNTCEINDPSLTGQESSKTQGENGTQIIIDGAGSEITDRVGEYIILHVAVTSEIMLAYVSSPTLLTNVYRGYFLDSAGDPIPRDVLNDDEILTILSGAWIFAENDALTIDVTYNSPIVSNTTPSSPVTGDYWFDREEGTWKRYDGASFLQINRILVGIAAIDATDCVGSRCFEFTKSYEAFNPIDVKYESASTIITARTDDVSISVYGTNVYFRHTAMIWDIATDLESGQSELGDTTYYLYVTEKGENVVSDIAPYDQRGTLKGFYHPYNTWRCVGSIFNGSGSDFDIVTLTRTSLGTAAFINVGTNGNEIIQLDELARLPGVDGSLLTSVTAGLKSIQVFTSSGTWNLPADINAIYTVVIGGGGGGAGGAGVAGSAGGTSSFGALSSATGGSGGVAGQGNNTLAGQGGSGGSGVGGNINIAGMCGGFGQNQIDAFIGGGHGGGTTKGGGGVGGGGNGNPGNNFPGEDGGNYGGGGGAAGGNITGQGDATGGGGGGGGTSEEYIASPSSSVSITIGAGGGGGGGDGGDGADGVVIVYEYQ